MLAVPGRRARHKSSPEAEAESEMVVDRGHDPPHDPRVGDDSAAPIRGRRARSANTDSACSAKLAVAVGGRRARMQ